MVGAAQIILARNDRMKIGSVGGPTYARRAAMQRRSVLTDRAVLAVPSLLALALPVAAGAVPHALGAADALVAAHACPALFAVAHTTHAHPVGPAVGRTHLCPKEREKEREKERRWARTRGVETTLIQETPKRQEREREREGERQRD